LKGGTEASLIAVDARVTASSSAAGITARGFILME
jgi:hypothetical protein